MRVAPRPSVNVPDCTRMRLELRLGQFGDYWPGGRIDPGQSRLQLTARATTFASTVPPTAYAPMPSLERSGKIRPLIVTRPAEPGFRYALWSHERVAAFSELVARGLLARIRGRQPRAELRGAESRLFRAAPPTG